jgi:tetratricopeptide (TPR) repeat protein
MLIFLKRFLYFLSNKIRRNQPGKLKEEKWDADFSNPENPPFDIKTESSYNAYLSDGALTMSLKKANCIAWIESPDHDYQDQIIEARFRLDSLGGYAAAGLMFRIAEEGTYYMALVSSKGYFRFDGVKNNSPRSLVGWTETPGFDGQHIDITIIAYNTQFIFLINGRWIAEIDDSLIPGGRPGFVMASYEAGGIAENGSVLAENDGFVCSACLDFLSVDSRTRSVEKLRQKWSDSPDIAAESRLRLAETFAALDNPSQALAQICRAWKRREEAARSVMATYTEMRTRRELLMAARLAFRLEQYDEADEYIDACLEQGGEGPERKEALAEKARILGELNKCAELRDFLLKHLAAMDRDPALYALLAQAHWTLKEYEPAAGAWGTAFGLNRENGMYAVKAANSWELLDKKEEALKYFLEAGTIFLRQGSHGDLAALMPRLDSLGGENWEARVLVGKWFFSIEDYDRAETEFTRAENIRCKLRPRPAADPAASYLRGLMLVLREKHREAARFFEDAVRLAPDFGLFRFKLAENRVFLSGGAYDPRLAADLQTALDLAEDDPEGQMANSAGNLLLCTGDLENADAFFLKALSVSPDNIEFISSRLSCLMELGRYGEAEEMLAHARLSKPSAAGLPELFQKLQSGQSGINRKGLVKPVPGKAGAVKPGKTGANKARVVKPEKAAAAAVLPAPEKKRGRPKKAGAEKPEPAAGGKARPAKRETVAAAVLPAPGKKRGRPRKAGAEKPEPAAGGKAGPAKRETAAANRSGAVKPEKAAAAVLPAPKKKRGRPRKNPPLV